MRDRLFNRLLGMILGVLLLTSLSVIVYAQSWLRDVMPTATDRYQIGNATYRWNNITVNLINATDWTNVTITNWGSQINNYPSACAGGQYVTAIGDTLTCDAPVGGGGGGDKWIDGGAYIYPNGTFANNTAIFGYLNATDWTNVTITNWASQMNNYPSTCGTGQFVKTVGDTLTCENDRFNTTTEILSITNNSKQWNASAICINGVCQSSWLWNTTAQIWSVVDNLTFRKISEGWRGNTTSEIWVVADNGTFTKLSMNLWNTTAQIWTVVDNGTFNTSTGVSVYVLAVNSTMKTYVISVNSTMKDYADGKNTAYNASMKDYADGRLLFYNTSAGTYAVSVNDTMRVYVLAVNGTMKTYAVSVNSTMKDYTDGKLTTYNTSAGTYTLAVNTTMKDYVISVNSTMKGYADGKFQTGTELFNTTAEIMTVVNSTNINSTAYINTTKGMSIGSNYKFCLNYGCTRYIYDNGTATIIQG